MDGERRCGGIVFTGRSASGECQTDMVSSPSSVSPLHAHTTSPTITAALLSSSSSSSSSSSPPYPRRSSRTTLCTDSAAAFDQLVHSGETKHITLTPGNLLLLPTAQKGVVNGKVKSESWSAGTGNGAGHKGVKRRVGVKGTRGDNVGGGGKRDLDPEEAVGVVGGDEGKPGSDVKKPSVVGGDGGRQAVMTPEGTSTVARNVITTNTTSAPSPPTHPSPPPTSSMDGSSNTSCPNSDPSVTPDIPQPQSQQPPMLPRTISRKKTTPFALASLEEELDPSAAATHRRRNDAKSNEMLQSFLERPTAGERGGGTGAGSGRGRGEGLKDNFITRIWKKDRCGSVMPYRGTQRTTRARVESGKRVTVSSSFSSASSTSSVSSSSSSSPSVSQPENIRSKLDRATPCATPSEVGRSASSEHGIGRVHEALCSSSSSLSSVIIPAPAPASSSPCRRRLARTRVHTTPVALPAPPSSAVTAAGMPSSSHTRVRSKSPIIPVASFAAFRQGFRPTPPLPPSPQTRKMTTERPRSPERSDCDAEEAAPGVDTSALAASDEVAGNSGTLALFCPASGSPVEAVMASPPPPSATHGHASTSSTTTLSSASSFSTIPNSLSSVSPPTTTSPLIPPAPVPQTLSEAHRLLKLKYDLIAVRAYKRIRELEDENRALRERLERLGGGSVPEGDAAATAAAAADGAEAGPGR